VTLLLLLGGSIPAAGLDWQRWSVKYAKNIIKRAMKLSSPGLGENLSAITIASMGGIGKTSEVRAVWLTRPVRQAFIRIEQIQERLTEDEALEALEHLELAIGDNYAFALSASAMIFGGPPPTILLADDKVNTGNPNRIFLQNPKNRKVFIRPTRIEESPPTFTSGFNTLKIPSVHKKIIILFPKDGSFLKDVKQDVELELVQNGKTRRLKFKPKDLVTSVEDL